MVNSLEKGGRTKRIVEEYLGLKRLGHHVHLVSFLIPPIWVSQHYACSDEWMSVAKSPLKFDFLLSYRLFKLFRSVKAELVHSHCESSSFYTGLVAKLIGIPSVGTIHRSQLRYYTPTWRNKLFYQFINHYIAVSEERKQRLVSQLGLCEDRVKVIQWGIEMESVVSSNQQLELRDKLNLSSGTLLFSSGHLGPIKGHDDSIVAVSLLRKMYPKIKLYIAGDGEAEDHERLHSLIETYNLQGCVVLLGQITNVLEWMQVCDIFLQPSREEAFGLVFLEAGMCGKPTVSTNIGGIPEVVIQGETGYLVDTHCPEQIAAKIADLLNSNETMSIMGEKARQHVSANFNLSDKVKQLETHLLLLAN